jgi:hypothetical protein
MAKISAILAGDQDDVKIKCSSTCFPIALRPRLTVKNPFLAALRAPNPRL